MNILARVGLAVERRQVKRLGLCPTPVPPLQIHDWRFDGYFWHHCSQCRAVS